MDDKADDNANDGNPDGEIAGVVGLTGLYGTPETTGGEGDLLSVQKFSNAGPGPEQDATLLSFVAV